MDAASLPASDSQWKIAAGLTTLLIGAITVTFLMTRPGAEGGNKARKTKAAAERQAGEEAEEEEEEEEDTFKEVPDEHMPKDGIFTAESLAPLNGEPFRGKGESLPLCMGVCGKVVNVSASGSIKPGAGYGALWAGRDATYSLATLSLKPEDACRMDFKLSDFDDEQKKALAGWYKHFITKYKVIGHMTEYDGWDFSEIELLAKDQTPFGMKKDSDEPPPEAEAAAPESSATAAPITPEAAADLPAGAKVFKKGARVEVRNLVSTPEKNGLKGTLQDFRADKGRFVVKIDDDDEVLLVKPDNLLLL